MEPTTWTWASGPKGLAVLMLVPLMLLSRGQAQSTAPAGGGVYVDPSGVMRWERSDEEIRAFGVNYTVPFAHAYRSAQKLGVDPLQAIDEDLYHFSRLGFDLYRVHVWDTEISDTLGHLLYNEHLHAFDYLLYQLAQRGINYVLTPIAYWGNGWPEPNTASPGFSAKYGKDACLTHPAAIEAQARYLAEFLQHVNPYTQVAYQDDPHLIAVEVSNEPHHREAPAAVTAFIGRMVASMRSTGYAKPIFYNISHSVHLVDAYFEAGIQGGTFQWYPTGLGYQQELPGNFLPYVDRYHIPFEPQIKAAGGAKLVYEFDAADVGRSYLYPAMARSFREAGIQIATHFAYDPTYLAYANTEYNTHYLNLAYTPGKALSLMIAGEVFRRVPMYEDFGRYPENATFGDFSVSYDQDLALLNSGEAYYHSNHSQAAPKNAADLRHIAGRGSSPLVQYDGTGAYFLDRLAAGLWRLEVMPDILVIDNPYGRNSLDKKVAEIAWNTRAMTLGLADLGEGFEVEPLNAGNEYEPTVSGPSFDIRPGTYLLRSQATRATPAPDAQLGQIRLNEFVAPAATIDRTHLLHQAPETVMAGDSIRLTAQVASSSPVDRVELWLGSGFRSRHLTLAHQWGFTYAATIPASEAAAGTLSYYLVVSAGGSQRTFPADLPGVPAEWDFYARRPYQIRVSAPTQPLYLFQAQADHRELSFTRWSGAARLLPLDHPAESELQVRLDSLFVRDAENLNAAAMEDYSIRHHLGPQLDPLRRALAGKKTLVFKGRSLGKEPTYLQVALITDDGRAFGQVIKLSPEMREYQLPIDALKPVPLVTLPRPYPTFLPYFFQPAAHDGALRLEALDAVQFSIGPGLPPAQKGKGHALSLVSLRLQ